MAERGAPKGNTNATKGTPWRHAINRAIAQGDPEKLRRIADKLLAKAEEGDITAIKELGDRLDGKATQPVDAKVDANVTIEIVKIANSD